jgi:hypothetical protein
MESPVDRGYVVDIQTAVQWLTEDFASQNAHWGREFNAHVDFRVDDIANFRRAQHHIEARVRVRSLNEREYARRQIIDIRHPTEMYRRLGHTPLEARSELYRYVMEHVTRLVRDAIDHVTTDRLTLLRASDFQPNRFTPAQLDDLRRRVESGQIRWAGDTPVNESVDEWRSRYLGEFVNRRQYHSRTAAEHFNRMTSEYQDYVRNIRTDFTVTDEMINGPKLIDINKMNEGYSID